MVSFPEITWQGIYGRLSVLVAFFGVAITLASVVAVLRNTASSGEPPLGGYATPMVVGSLGVVLVLIGGACMDVTKMRSCVPRCGFKRLSVAFVVLLLVVPVQHLLFGFCVGVICLSAFAAMPSLKLQARGMAVLCLMLLGSVAEAMRRAGAWEEFGTAPRVMAIYAFSSMFLPGLLVLASWARLPKVEAVSCAGFGVLALHSATITLAAATAIVSGAFGEGSVSFASDHCVRFDGPPSPVIWAHGKMEEYVRPPFESNFSGRYTTTTEPGSTTEPPLPLEGAPWAWNVAKDVVERATEAPNSTSTSSIAFTTTATTTMMGANVAMTNNATTSLLNKSSIPGIDSNLTDGNCTDLGPLESSWDSVRAGGFFAAVGAWSVVVITLCVCTRPRVKVVPHYEEEEDEWEEEPDINEMQLALPDSSEKDMEEGTVLARALQPEPSHKAEPPEADAADDAGAADEAAEEEHPRARRRCRCNCRCPRRRSSPAEVEEEDMRSGSHSTSGSTRRRRFPGCRFRCCRLRCCRRLRSSPEKAEEEDARSASKSSNKSAGSGGSKGSSRTGSKGSSQSKGSGKRLKRSRSARAVDKIKKKMAKSFGSKRTIFLAVLGGSYVVPFIFYNSVLKTDTLLREAPEPSAREDLSSDALCADRCSNIKNLEMKCEDPGCKDCADCAEEDPCPTRPPSAAERERPGGVMDYWFVPMDRVGTTFCELGAEAGLLLGLLSYLCHAFACSIAASKVAAYNTEAAERKAVEDLQKKIAKERLAASGKQKIESPTGFYVAAILKPDPLPEPTDVDSHGRVFNI
eukprot:gnl/TRDRNA2_/TRDRNA2_35583_c0_seq1.p1 gnl/TRDRNA2_/TRDRNA2_35583_c0~~gnl/TRDRNA2_/TRDRNA2_35583_c0_seq1.p1  ORF type:complete len:802 (-),score=133.46 gnl/TRDRNA2_/TRDRNA2_35583_c0_seq1:15-2420(-)